MCGLGDGHVRQCSGAFSNRRATTTKVTRLILKPDVAITLVHPHDSNGYNAKSRTRSRRELLSFLFALQLRGASAEAQLALLPLITPQQDKPVRSTFVDAAAVALTRVYRVSVSVRAQESFDGHYESEAILDYLAQRSEFTMAVMNTPLRATARTGLWSGAREVSGVGDLPNDQRARPRGSIITTYWLAGPSETAVEHWLGIVAIHEFGHNLGAWDCNDRGCYMHYKIDLARGPIPRQFCRFHEDLLERALRSTQRHASH